MLSQQEEARDRRKAKKRDTSAGLPPALLTRLDSHLSIPFSSWRPLDRGLLPDHFVSRTVTVIW
jgi:hypothetical protein